MYHTLASVVKRCSVGVLALFLLVWQPGLAVAAKPVALQATDQSSVIVKFKPDAQVDTVNGVFESRAGVTVTGVNQAFKGLHVVKRLVSQPSEQLQNKRSSFAESLPSGQGDLENYFTVKLAPTQKADDVVKTLKTQAIVATAYAKPMPAPAPSTPSFVAKQTYLWVPGIGMGVNAHIGSSTKLYPGIDGNKVQVADLEYSWNVNHEDLPVLAGSGALWAINTPTDPFNDANHGTAVAGVIAASRNGFGVDGITPASHYHMVNTNSAENGWDVPGAILAATDRMVAGDVMLLEQQGWAPDYDGFAPIEIYPAVYDAIKLATAKGIVVVEAAGNGHLTQSQGYNLDDPLFGDLFGPQHPSSGAIIVGAGAAGCSGIPAHARMPFSNYGSRVDVQGYGECVTTTGYGDLQNTLNATYTSGFNGTSSASATVAGVAAELSSSYKQTNGVAMAQAAFRAAFVTLATPQNTTVNPGNIGALPNMLAALRLTDKTRPSVVKTLPATLNASKKVVVKWLPATDNLGVVTYRIYREGVLLKTASASPYTDTTVKPKTTYHYKVIAVDASGNVSPASNTVAIKTP